MNPAESLSRRVPVPGVGAYHLDVAGTTPDLVHVRVAGDIDYLVTPCLRRQLIERLVGAVEVLILDLTMVTLLSVAAMETLLIVEEMAHEYGVRLHVVADTRAVLHPLSLTGLDRRLRVHRCAADALDSD